MWSKEEEQSESPRPTPPAKAQQSTEQTRIGASVTLEGTIKCEEDLRLEGQLKGAVSVPNHRVVVGASGKVRADVHARVIEVEGNVVGDLVGVERVVVTATGNVVGNLKAPRVSLENGAQFKGSIDMDPAGSGVDAGTTQRKGPRQSVAPAAAPVAANAKSSTSVS